MVTRHLHRHVRTQLLAIAAVAILGGLAIHAQSSIPGRIVSTSPNITETLFALGLGDRVVGVSTYCRFPAEAVKLPRVGTFLRPDTEIIARLEPDLVFLNTGPNAAASQLGSLGIKTAMVESGSLAHVFTTIRGIGAAAGVPDRAAKLVADINRRLDRMKSAVAGRAPKRVLIIVGRQTGTLTDIVAVGRGSYLSDIAAIAGGINALDTTTQYPRISMETIISVAPDVLIDIGEMGESPTDSDRRKAITTGLWQRQTLVKAVRDGSVRVTTNEAFVVPGPRVIDVAELMALWFHNVQLP
jgi:iron complex transport system substrate-binding protein